GIAANYLKGKSRNKLIAGSKISEHIYKTSPTDPQKIFHRFLASLHNREACTTAAKHLRYDIQPALQPILRQVTESHNVLPTFIAYQAVQNNLYYLRLLKEMSDLLSQWRKENSAQLISDAQILLNRLGLDEQNDPTFIWQKIGNRYNYFLF